MKNPDDKKRLLEEVLDEAAPTDFREQMLGEMLRHARRRHRGRQLRRSAVALALVCGVGLSLYHLRRNNHSSSSRLGFGTDLPENVSLSSVAIVTTQPLAPECLVTSYRGAEWVETTFDLGKFRTINDNELLALSAPRSAVLVRLGPQLQELIFLNPN